MKTIQANIHNIKENKSETLTLQDSRLPSVTYYNIDGLVFLTGNEVTSLAKREDHHSGAVYYLKSGPDGLFNPYSMYSMGSAHLSARKNGSYVWSYHKVSKEAFDCYIHFLQSKNQSKYIEANRLVKASPF